MGKIGFIARKEMYHILRDPRSLIIIFAMPVLMTFLYGFAINLDIENVNLAIMDFDRTPESRDLTQDFYESTYFSPPSDSLDYHDPEQILRRREASGILIIRDGFGEAVKNQRAFSLGLMVDGSDNLLAAAVQAYSHGVLGEYLKDQVPPNVALPGITVSKDILFNPDLKSSHFFVPAIVAIILIMISALLTSITIAREKETGTMEQLLVAPVSPRQIILGKVLPYILIAFIDGMLVILFAKLTFGVPFEGSFLLLMFFTAIYVSASLSVGILVSSMVKTQQVAMMLALVITMLPSIMLSGFIFAVRMMPVPLQVISTIVPATYYITATRGILLKGSNLHDLGLQAVVLLGLMAVLILIATKRFNTRVE